MKTFYTIFPTDTPISLVKDVGLFPTYLVKTGHYEVHLVSHIVYDDVPSYVTQMEGVILEYVRPPKHLTHSNTFLYISLLKYIWCNACKIDYLNLYSIKSGLLPAMIYHLRNPRGKVWLKGDAQVGLMPSPKTLVGRLKLWGFSFGIRHWYDLITIESIPALTYHQQLFPSLTRRIRLLPNGVNDEQLPPLPEYRSKKNIIISVSRFGNYAKNSEFLLDVLTKIEWFSDWRCIVIGPIETHFQEKIDTFFLEHPSLRERVSFIGMVTDRNKLFEYYRQAKVFCCTSRTEGFNLAIIEAMSMGNYLFTTPISMAQDIIGEDCGKIVSTPQTMASELTTLLHDETPLREVYPHVLTHSKDFYMSHIIPILDRYLSDLTS